jgi:hypothetical protein
MTSQYDKGKRWRPRFSVRTLAIIVTLVCCYVACWGPTTRNGPRDIIVRQQLARDNIIIASARPVAPLLVGAIRYDLEVDAGAKCYYFWFFGYVAKLPYERELP